MSRLKERLRVAEKMKRNPETPFKQVNTATSPQMPPGMTRAFSNNRYIVMIYDNTRTTHGPATRALIQTIDDKPIVNHWAEIQRIKNEIFGRETMGIEYYPREQDLINQHNIYWLWIFPDGEVPEML